MMTAVAPDATCSEDAFAAYVNVAVQASRADDLLDLLREDHPVYDQRGRAEIVRMRGWLLTALASIGPPDAALPFLIEELESGLDRYLIAAAARALRAYDKPLPGLAPIVARAIANNAARDEPVSFETYGAYTTSDEHTVVGELKATLAWLESQPRSTSTVEDCCALPWSGWRRWTSTSTDGIDALTFEDQDGVTTTFRDVFDGAPTIVVFFYSRCDNPRKCSMTITRLAETQRLLAARGLIDQIRTVGITYDPAFDLPERLRRYGRDRRLRLDGSHRLLRAPEGIDALRRHFGLGVNFVESLVNRHRLEVYVLDRHGRTAASFERIAWTPESIVDHASTLLIEPRHAAAPLTSPALGTIASLGVALFPKCPVCWATYLSATGIAGLAQVPYAPWLQPVLVTALLCNVAFVAWRSRASRRWWPLALAAGGAIAVLMAQASSAVAGLSLAGATLTFAGSVMSALEVRATNTTGWSLRRMVNGGRAAATWILSSRKRSTHFARASSNATPMPSKMRSAS